MTSSAKFIPPGFTRQKDNDLLHVYCQELIPLPKDDPYFLHMKKECRWDYDDAKSYEEGTEHWWEHWSNNHWWEKDVS